MDVHVAKDESEVTASFELRERVFCGEQGVSPAAERDGRDREAIHVVAVDGGSVVGTCRVLLEGELARLGRMAVAPALRRRGVGGSVLAEAERAARGAGARRMRLHAQSVVQDLYARAGYRERGAPFVEEGIPHVAMEKRLA